MKKNTLNGTPFLSFLKPYSISIYIHIPFCAYRCHYCNFYLETGFSMRVMQDTVSMILAECEQQYLKLGKPVVTSLYFGGGTPSLLPAQLLEKFLSGLKSILGDFSFKEATFEMNPESCSQEKLDVLAHFGFQRISLGVQTFRAKFLKEMGRRCEVEEIEKAIRLLKQKWSGQYSLDIITGYPGQTKQDVEADIKQVLKSKPDHISLYDLTIEDRTALQILIDTQSLTALDADVKEELWLYARYLLRSEGYLDYEISNFSLKGKQSQHNRAYWCLDPYLGLGPGAVSMLLLQGDKGLQAFRANNASLFNYRRGEECKREYISAQDYLFEHFLMGLRMREGVSKARIQQRFGKWVVDQLEKLFRESGLQNLKTTQHAWCLNEKGRDLLNPFLLDLEIVMSRGAWDQLKILGY